MLRQIRDNAQGTAAKTILGLIIISFAFFGVESLIGSGGSQAVLEVNGKEILGQELSDEVNTLRRERMAQMGENIDFAQLEEQRLIPIAIERMLQQELINQAAAEIDLGASEKLVEQTITQIPALHVDGQFSNERLSTLLADQGLTLAVLKRQVADNLINNQLQAGIAASGFSLDFNAKVLFEIINETREVSWLKLPFTQVSSGIEMSEEQLAEYFEQNRSNYTSPLLVSVDYIELSVEGLFEPASEEAIASEYQRQLDQFTSSERRDVSHILLEVNELQSREAALAQIKIIQSKLQSGNTFADLAREFSQDGGSSQDGGALGYTEKDGTYPDVFEEAIFSLSEGVVSAPVETDAGIHLVMVADIDEVEVPTFDSLRSTLELQVQRQEAEKKYISLVEELADTSFNSEGLESPAELLGLELHQSAAITRNGSPGQPNTEVAVVLKDARVLDAVFAADVVEDGLNSALIELSPSQSVVARVREVFQPRQLEFGEVKVQVTAALSQQLTTDYLDARANELVNSKHTSESLASFAESNEYEFKARQRLTRRSADVDRSLLQSIFEASRADAGSQTPRAETVANGDRYIYLIGKIESGNESMSQQEQELFSTQIKSFSGQQDIAAYMQSIRARAEIERAAL